MTGEPHRDLPTVVAEVKARIGELSHRRSRIGEQNTKGVLIEPVLSALGWDLWNLNEVSREYRHKSQDDPVDYALFLDQFPCLFVEAKALGTDLRDRRLASQTIAYAATVGVEWCVLTDGDEYRLYNAHAPVDVDEKLFRKVKISDAEAGDDIVETLSLLTKKKMAENRLAVLWKSEFIDRRIQAALEDSIGGQDVRLINLLRKRLGDLTGVDIRGSLERLDVSVKPIIPTPSVRHGRKVVAGKVALPEGVAGNQQRATEYSGPALVMNYRHSHARALYNGGQVVVLSGSTIMAKTHPSLKDKDRELRKRLSDEGTLGEDETNGLLTMKREFPFKSPSQAARFVAGCSVSGNRDWHIENSGAPLGSWLESVRLGNGQVRP